jgi:hypothetical protein
MTLPLGGIRSPRERTIWLERRVAEQAREIDQIYMLLAANNQPPERPPWEVANSSGGGVSEFAGTLNHNLYRGATGVTATSGSTTVPVLSSGRTGFLAAGQLVEGLITASNNLLVTTGGAWVARGALTATYSGSGSGTVTGGEVGSVGSLTISFTDPDAYLAMLGGSIPGGSRIRLDWDDKNIRFIFLTANQCPSTGSGGSSASLGQIAALTDLNEVML